MFVLLYHDVLLQWTKVTIEPNSVNNEHKIISVERDFIPSIDFSLGNGYQPYPGTWEFYEDIEMLETIDIPVGVPVYLR